MRRLSFLPAKAAECTSSVSPKQFVNFIKLSALLQAKTIIPAFSTSLFGKRTSVIY
jgi:hypothetical protein